MLLWSTSQCHFGPPNPTVERGDLRQATSVQTEAQSEGPVEIGQLGRRDRAGQAG